MAKIKTYRQTYPTILFFQPLTYVSALLYNPIQQLSELCRRQQVHPLNTLPR